MSCVGVIHALGNGKEKNGRDYGCVCLHVRDNEK